MQETVHFPGPSSGDYGTNACLVRGQWLFISTQNILIPTSKDLSGREQARCVSALPSLETCHKE